MGRLQPKFQKGQVIHVWFWLGTGDGQIHLNGRVARNTQIHPFNLLLWLKLTLSDLVKGIASVRFWLETGDGRIHVNATVGRKTHIHPFHLLLRLKLMLSDLIIGDWVVVFIPYRWFCMSVKDADFAYFCYLFLTMSDFAWLRAWEKVGLVVV